MADNNLYNIERTALPKDVKVAMSGLLVDNFALLFNRMAHFGVKENIGANNGDVYKLLAGEIKAHFFHKSKVRQDTFHLDLTQKWKVSEALKEQYESFLATHQAAANALFSTHEELKLTANWRIAIGMGNESVYENGFTFHPTYGIPYLPGTSLKGMTRHWAAANGQGEDLNLMVQIFGNDNEEKKDFQQGRIIFFDAYPTQLRQDMLQPDIMNNHYPDYYEGKKPPADWLSPRPIFFLTMKEVVFQFLLGVIPRPAIKEGELDNQTLLNTAKRWLENALFESGVGAKTAVGYGRMRQPTGATTAQNSHSEASAVKPEFQKGSPDKKLKPDMAMEAEVTTPGKPCKATVYGFGGKKYENVTVSGSVQNLKPGDVIKVTIQTDGKGEKITSASFQGLKQH